MIPVTDHIQLELLHPKHAQQLLQIVNTNRQRLSQWDTWVPNMQTEADFLGFINNSLEAYNANIQLPMCIIHEGQVVGRIGIYHLNNPNLIGEIGYWISEDAGGKGIVTQSCKAIMNYAFNSLNLNRIDLKCGTENHKSIAIANKLGFIHEGILHQAKKLHTGFIDLMIFGMLKENWKL